MPSVTIGGKHVPGQPAWRRPEPPGVTAEARFGGFAPNGFRSGARVVADVRSDHASGLMSTWSKSPRLGPEAIGGTIRTCAGPAADKPIGRSTPAARRAACRASTAQAGCREPPDLLGVQKRTGGKVLRVQDY
jgi:hypothetical protein